jgi:hypothetical protein
MKNILLIGIAIAINIGLLKAQEPEQVYSIAKVYKPHEWYLKQAELWWKEIQKDKKNETAWYNYFLANRMTGFEFDNHGDSTKKDYEETKFMMNTDSIVSQAQRFIPNTFTSHYIIWRNHGSTPEDFPHLERAYSLNPNFFGINEEMVSYYETQYNLAKRKEFNNKWFKLNELSLSLLTYNYNVLMTIQPNGAIITFGDNDSFPIWMLQDALGIRQDVTVLNTSLLCIPEYRAKVFKKLNIPDFNKQFPNGSEGATSENTDKILNHILKNKPKDLALYIGLPAWKQFKDNSQNFYLVGLALQYSLYYIDNIAMLKNNFENKYALDYIENNLVYDISSEIANKQNINYLPGIFKLYEHYILSGDLTHSKKMKDLGLLIAQKGGQDWLNKASLILK